MVGSSLRFLLRAYYSILKLFVGAVMFILIIPLTYQIFARLLPIPNIIWTEELSRFLLIWLILSASILGVKDKAHFQIDIFNFNENSVAKRLSDIFVNIVCFLLSIYFIYHGYAYLIFASTQTSDLMGINLAIINGSIFISGTGWAIAFLELLFKSFKKGV